jgi:DNA-binding response OmpR family regulator
MHALIIEDESLIAMAIEDVLRGRCFSRFDLAASAQTAIDAAVERTPDLITSDVQLKPGCGVETLRIICSRTEIPVIFITGNADDVPQRMPDCQVLNKPFSEEKLIAAVTGAFA